MRAARRVRRAGRGNGLTVRPVPRPGPTQPGPSTVPCCTPWQRASTSISCDGPCRSSNDCAAGRPGHGGGSTPFDGANPPCSPTGTCCLPSHAGLWEPYDGRPSRTVLREREGEAPSRYSPGRAHQRPQRRRVQDQDHRRVTAPAETPRTRPGILRRPRPALHHSMIRVN